MHILFVRRRSLPCRAAFTLLELLVVISIIAVLAGLLLPVVSSVMDRARKTDAKSTETQIVTAVTNYETDYGQYPVEPPTSGAVDATFDKNAANTTGGEYGPNHTLFNVLRTLNVSGSGDATYVALNSRKVTYFEAKDVKNTADPRDGFVPAGATGMPRGLVVGDLVDPWGNLYSVRIDANYTDKILKPYPATDKTPFSGNQTGTVSYQYTGTALSDSTDPNNPTTEVQVFHLPVVSWSAGKDNLMGDQGTTNPGALTTSCDDVASWQ